MAKLKVIVADDTYANLLLMQARLEDMDCDHVDIINPVLSP